VELGRISVTIRIWAASFLLALAIACPAHAQQISLRCDPAQSKADWNLSDPLHTVKGEFKLKQCELHYDPSSGKASGEIVFDATTGQSGNHVRDHKMHNSVLESEKYPEIRFRPDHVEGPVNASGESKLQVHGVFSIHGGDHDITLPVTLNLGPAQWSASSQFSVPYVQWGMKNPSVLFLHVGDNVAIAFQAAGSVVSGVSGSSR